MTRRSGLRKTKGFIAVFLVASVFIMRYNILKAEEMMKERFIGLPKPVLKGALSVEEAISRRRSVRSYQDKQLGIEQISQILWAAQGITDEKGLRAAPSAGALYPLEIYIAKKDGLFHYVPKRHGLENISGADLRQKLAQASWGQGFVAEAPVDIIICAVYERVISKYGDRGIRYTDIEAGHAAQNVHLQAAALGLDSVPVGAFDGNAVSALLGLSKDEKPIYIIPVGYKK